MAETTSRVGYMALAVKSGEMISISRSHSVVEENQFLHVVL